MGNSTPGADGVRWVFAAGLDDIPEGTVRSATVDGMRLALVKREGEVYALDAVCPHQQGPLDQGELWRGAVECPWHRFRYDPVTGANIYPANVYPDDAPELKRRDLRPAQVFPVEVRGGKIFVGLPAEAPAVRK